jgi:probable F420-dependent oxidoreductase
MQVWYHASFTPMDQLIEVARLVEGAGFDGLGLTHHLVTPGEIAPEYPYSDDGSVSWDPASPIPDVWVTSVVLARATSRIAIGPSVFVLPLQDPFTLAKAASTAACFAEGRLVLGFGTGWMSQEFELTGQEFATRGRRADESLDVLRLLLSGEMVEYAGAHHRFEPVQMAPVPKEPLRLYGGGRAGAAIRRAARADGWFMTGPLSLDETIRHLVAMREARAEAGRLDDPFEIILPVVDVPEADDWARLSEHGATGVMLSPGLARPMTTVEDRRSYIDETASAVREIRAL